MFQPSRYRERDADETTRIYMKHAFVIIANLVCRGVAVDLLSRGLSGNLPQHFKIKLTLTFARSVTLWSASFRFEQHLSQ